MLKMHHSLRNSRTRIDTVSSIQSRYSIAQEHLSNIILDKNDILCNNAGTDSNYHVLELEIKL